MRFYCFKIHVDLFTELFNSTDVVVCSLESFIDSSPNDVWLLKHLLDYKNKLSYSHCINIPMVNICSVFEMIKSTLMFELIRLYNGGIWVDIFFQSDNSKLYDNGFWAKMIKGELQQSLSLNFQQSEENKSKEYLFIPRLVYVTPSEARNLQEHFLYLSYRYFAEKDEVRQGLP